MSEQGQREEAARLLQEIQYELRTQPLTPEQRHELEIHAARLAGTLLRPWLPITWASRLIAVAIAVIGIQQAWVGNYQPLVWWVLLPFFSPRIMGECAYYLGVLSRPFRKRA